MKKVYIVGLGPGGKDDMTVKALEAMKESDIICGYTVYVKLVQDLYPGKEFYTTGMRGEMARCKWALEQADAGKTVALVCSGDSGVYGMAGLMFELSVEHPEVELVVVPGITAAVSGSAVLGAVTGHDFCTISLSTHLTPWELIEKRLRAAAEADFIIALYNPMSKTRPDTLKDACRILLEVKAGDTMCGWVRNIGRENEEMKIMTLEQLACEDVDMFTTVFIGSSRTRELAGHLVTPRGYIDKYGM